MPDATVRKTRTTNGSVGRIGAPAPAVATPAFGSRRKLSTVAAAPLSGDASISADRGEECHQVIESLRAVRPERLLVRFAEQELLAGHDQAGETITRWADGTPRSLGHS